MATDSKDGTSAAEDVERYSTEFAAVLAGIALALGTLVLLAIAGYLFYDMLHYALNAPRHVTSQQFAGSLINEVLLIFIILELVETAYTQIVAGISGGIEKALGKPLAQKLLVIGLLASIRHLLAIGIELSGRTYPSGARLQDILEGLGVATGMVIGLTVVLVVLVRGYSTDDDR